MILYLALCVCLNFIYIVDACGWSAAQTYAPSRHNCCGHITLFYAPPLHQGSARISCSSHLRLASTGSVFLARHRRLNASKRHRFVLSHHRRRSASSSPSPVIVAVIRPRRRRRHLPANCIPSQPRHRCCLRQSLV